MTEIQTDLFALQDCKYRDFNAKLIPNIDKSSIIGVRTPELRKYAKIFMKSENAADFINTYRINTTKKITFTDLSSLR